MPITRKLWPAICWLPNTNVQKHWPTKAQYARCWELPRWDPPRNDRKWALLPRDQDPPSDTEKLPGCALKTPILLRLGEPPPVLSRPPRPTGECSPSKRSRTPPPTVGEVKGPPSARPSPHPPAPEQQKASLDIESESWRIPTACAQGTAPSGETVLEQ